MRGLCYILDLFLKISLGIRLCSLMTTALISFRFDCGPMGVVITGVYYKSGG